MSTPIKIPISANHHPDGYQSSDEEGGPSLPLHDDGDDDRALTGSSLAASLSQLNGSLSALDAGGGDGSSSSLSQNNANSTNNTTTTSEEIPVGSLPSNRFQRRKKALATTNQSPKQPLPTMAYSYTGGGRGLPSLPGRTPPRAPVLHATADATAAHRLARMPDMALPESALEHSSDDGFGGGGGGGPSNAATTTTYGSLNDCSFQRYARSRMMQHGSARMRAAGAAARRAHPPFRKGGGSPIIEGAEHAFSGDAFGGGAGGGGGGTNAIGGPAGGIGGAVASGTGAAADAAAYSLPPDYHSDLVRRRWEDATAATAGGTKPSPLLLGLEGAGIELGPSPLSAGRTQPTSSLAAQLNDLALAPPAAASASSASTSGEAGGSGGTGGGGGIGGMLDLGLGAVASADYGSAGLDRRDSGSAAGRPRGGGSLSYGSDHSHTDTGGGGGGGDGPASFQSLTALEILSSSRQSLERRLGSPVGGAAGLAPGAAAAGDGDHPMAMNDQHQPPQPMRQALAAAGGGAGVGGGAHFLPDQQQQQQQPDVVPFEVSENPPGDRDNLTDDEGAFDLDL